jgi:hypothetical protein
MEKYRHKLFRRGVWSRRRPPNGSRAGFQGKILLRNLVNYTTEKMTFLIILKVLLTT